LSIRGENVTTRFVSDKYGAELLFYPAPEPTYKERQKEWVVKNKVCIGTKVRITSDFRSDEDDSNCIFETENVGKKKIVGEVGRVTGIYYDCILVEVHVENWRCPFTVLEVIKETYRPFNDDELNDIVGKVVTNKCTGNNKLVTERTGPSAVRVGNTGCTAKDLFHCFVLDGKPCGVKEEA
jgi:hypothetical protein